jgi:Icc-related predicted phosphoesterase
VIDCLFATDLHGSLERYRKLFRSVASDPPDVVLLGGDLLPGLGSLDERSAPDDFVSEVLAGGFERLRADLGTDYPEVLLILGNDDGRAAEPALVERERHGLWTYLHGRCRRIGGCDAYGYSYVPPTPFQLKDWERYDVSRYVDPGCVAPEDGRHSVPGADVEARRATIREDLARLTGDADLRDAVFLFHAPPHGTKLDRAALDGQYVDHAPVDVHVGSIAVRRFIEERQPRLCLHGHVHESVRLTGAWSDRIGRTLLFGGAHDGPELALIRFDLEAPAGATRRLL